MPRALENTGLVVVGVDLEVSLGMAADGAHSGSLQTVLQMAAVAAVPDLDVGPLEDLAVGEVLGQLHVALLVALLDLAHSGEGVGQSVEALLPGGLGHLLIHLGPLFVLTLGGRKFQLFPRNTSYGMIYLTCAVIAAAVAAALLLGTAAAYYLIFALVAWLFIMAVYYTVKLM